MRYPVLAKPIRDYYDIKIAFCQVLSVNTFIASEKEFNEQDDTLPDNLAMIYFKMVSMGVNTLKEAQYSTKNIVKVVNNQAGFFLVSDDNNDLRKSMHDLVDRFCNAREKQI